ncbi:MAG: DoxX family protein [Planctomycetes bacterium]|nr:DoxX family protein [Planctomycetota bacterium]
MKWQNGRALLRIVLAFFFVGAGVLHFVRPKLYLEIMPPYLPWHRELVYLSGVFEITGGLGILVPSLRRAAGWGLIALLVAVFPANVQMFLDALATGWTAKTVIALVRLPLQIPLILWVWWCMRDAPG